MLTEKSFEKLFREYVRPLTVYAIQFVKSQEIAEDIVQNLFLNLYEKRESLRIMDLTSNYLYRSVHNRCLNSLRDQKTRNEKKAEIQDSPNADSSDPLQLMTDVEFEYKFMLVLETLSPQCRKVFEMSRLEHKRNRQIADELNLSKRTVETHISRALKIMREKLLKYIIFSLMLFCMHLFF